MNRISIGIVACSSSNALIRRLHPVHADIIERCETWNARWKAGGGSFDKEQFIENIQKRYRTTSMSLETSLAIQDDLEYEKLSLFLSNQLSKEFAINKSN